MEAGEKGEPEAGDDRRQRMWLQDLARGKKSGGSRRAAERRMRKGARPRRATGMGWVVMTTWVFDVDGVIVTGDSFGVALAREHGISVACLAPFFAGPFGDCLVGRRDLKTELAAWLPGWGWPKSTEAFLEFWFSHETQVNEPLLAVVRELRVQGARCVLGTNQERYRADYLWNELGLRAEFDGLFASGDLGVMKPHAAFYAAVEVSLGTTQGLCLVDDRLGNVMAARAAGWRAVHYRGPEEIALLQAEAEADLPNQG